MAVSSPTRTLESKLQERLPLPDMASVDFSGVKGLVSFPVGLLPQLQSAQTIDLSNTSLCYDPSKALKSCASLRRVILSNTALSQIPSLPRRVVIVMDNCKKLPFIKFFLSAFRSMNKGHLNLKNAKGFWYLPNWFANECKRSKVKTIDLSQTGLKLDPANVLSRIEGLTRVDLSQTKICIIPKLQPYVKLNMRKCAQIFRITCVAHNHYSKAPNLDKCPINEWDCEECAQLYPKLVNLALMNRTQSSDLDMDGYFD